MSSRPLSQPLSQRAFPAHPRVDRYFASASAEAARHRLCQCLQRGDGPALLLGVPGVGKTMLLETIAAETPRDLRVVRLGAGQLCTRRALLQALLHGLGAPYRDREEGELRISLSEALSDPAVSAAGVIVLVDEAQAMPIRLLEELRVLSNVAIDGSPRIRLVLSGTHRLDEQLTAPELDAFNQRVAARCYLEPMTREETIHYVRAHIAAAGGTPDSLFSSDAYESIVLASDGIPRLVNQVCDRAMVLSVEQKRAIIDSVAINEAWADLHQLAAPWQSPAASKLAASPGESPEATSDTSVEYGLLEDDALGEALLAEAEAITSVHSEIAENLRASAAVWNADEKLRDLQPSEEPVADELTEEFEDDGPVAYAFPIRDQLADLNESETKIDLPEPAKSEDDLREDLETAALEPIGEVEPVKQDTSSNPFAEEFDEEEVVLDPYATLERVIPAAPEVAMLEASSISKAYAEISGAEEIAVTVSDTIAEIAADVELGVTVASTDEGSMLIVEDTEEATPVEQSVRREDYAQLFAQLRRG